MIGNFSMSFGTAAAWIGAPVPAAFARPAATAIANGPHAPVSARAARYRYNVVVGNEHPMQPLRRHRRTELSADNETATPLFTSPAPPLSDADIDRLLLLRPGEQHAADRRTLNAVLDYANICHAGAAAGQGDALSDWWARLRDYAAQYARDDLDRIGHNLHLLFFETPPERRPAEWQRLSASAKRDVNLILDLAEVIHASDRPFVRTSYNAILPALARIMENLPAPHASDRALRDSETPYLLSLTCMLRKHRAVEDPYFQNRVEIMPGDVLSFVRTAVLKQDPEAPGQSGISHRRHLDQDLSALLYRALRHRCATTADDPLTLASLREGFAGALLAEEKDGTLLADMFADNGRPEEIYHDGWVLRNARGKAPADLVEYLDAHGPPEMAGLHHGYKLSLVRRKLYQLGEYAGDYKFGSIVRAMATVLMRTSSLPAPNRYIIYASALDLEEQWVARIKEEIERGNMPYMLEIVEAVYSERANGVEEWNTQSYRKQYNNLIGAIEAAAASYGCNAKSLASIWRWLAGRMPGWRTDAKNFDDSISVARYAASIENAVDVFYQIAQSSNYPDFHTTDILTAQGNLVFHPLLDGPPKCAGQALTSAAKQFDYSPFLTERTVSDKQKPAYTLIQKMENTFYRNTYELRPGPFWNVEAQAYETLLASNLTAAQISEGVGSIYSNVHDSEYFRRPRPLHDAFIAVIRNVDADALLLLPNGKTIKPYRLIKQSYDLYHAGLEKHPWVVGSARQQMHEKKMPFLPSVQKAEIKRIAQTLSVPSIATESGTEAADELLSSLPIFAPTLQLARALRDDKSHKLYYVLLIARDVLATAAMGKMIFAAYVTPFIMGMRLSASAVLAARMIPGKTMSSVRRLSHGLRKLSVSGDGYASFDMQRRKAPKAEKRDIPIIGDQTQPGGFRKQTNRARSGGNAARRISKEQESNNGTLITVDGAGINPDIWLQLMTLIAPTLSQNARQFHAMLKINGKSQAAVFNMSIGNNIENTGARVGLKGLTSADAFTLCGTQALEERQTVQDAMAWQIKSLDDQVCEGNPIRDNLRIDFAADVEAAWTAHPDWRYDPMQIVEQAFNSSIALRQLFNLYDSRPVHPHSIAIKIDTQCLYPRLQLRGPAGDIFLPADPGCLPFVVNARHVARQSPESAVIENVVHTILAKVTAESPAPRRPLHERGLGIWLANRIRRQTDPHADPRVNALAFDSQEEAQRIGVRAIRDAAELEDQYLERVNPEDPIAVRLHAFPAIAHHPTVKAVIGLARRIGLPAYLQRLNSPESAGGFSANDISNGDFLDRFRHRFAIDTGRRSTADIDQFIATAHLFFGTCHERSPLFRRLFDHGLKRREQQWIIFPGGYAGDTGIEYDILIPSQGIINAAADKALYLGLMDVEPHPRNASIAVPTSSLRPLEPFRRMLDGVIAALAGADLLLPRTTAFEHRGAVAWASDTVLLEAIQDADMPPNKRLAQIAVSADNAAECKRLRKSAGQRREQARDEDAYLDHWFATVNSMASP